MPGRAAVRGFTLLEVLLVLIIFSISIALVVPVVSGGFGSAEARSTAKKLGAAFNQAKALSVRERIDYLVEVNDRKISVKSVEGHIKKEIEIPDGVSITSQVLNVTFSPRGGSSGGEFEVSREGHAALIVIVTHSGQARVEENASKERPPT